MDAKTSARRGSAVTAACARRCRATRRGRGWPCSARTRHIYAQLIDDRTAATIAQASDREVSGEGKTARAKAVGALIAQRAKDAGVERVVFDRGGRLYHGRVAALAEGAREGGLQI